MTEEEIKKQYYANGIINVTNKKSEEEIKRQYANRIVNADEVIKSLIDKFKTDKTSVDIQQLQLMAEYLIYKADKLQKENTELKEEN